MHTPARDTIERLTLRWAASPEQAHLPATHLRVERLLNAVEWQPRGMRPGEILLVRHLRGLPALSDVRAWREQLQRRMDDLYRRAARPQHGRIDPYAASVLFRDAAEFIACLTRDALERPSAPAWYWSRALAEPLPFSPGARLAALWSAQPEALPAALAVFTVVEVQQAVALLTPQEVARVIHALHVAHSLPDVVLRATAPAVKTGYILSLQEEHPASTVLPGIRPPWQALFRPAAEPALPPPAHYLLGLAVTLRQAPSFARSATFAQQAAAWLIAESAPEVTAAAEPQETAITSAHEHQRDEAQWTPEPASAHPSFAEPPPARPSDALPTTPPSALPVEQDRAPARPAPEAAASRAAPALDAAASPAALSPPAPEVAEAIAEPPMWVNEPVFAQEGVSTQYGGVLYLINLLTWLGLPGEWDGDLGAHLSGWALVEALALALLGAVDEDDALWGILAQLDHRAADTPIGADFPALLPPTRWRVRVAVRIVQAESQDTQGRKTEEFTAEAQRTQRERREVSRGGLARSAYILPYGIANSRLFSGAGTEQYRETQPSGSMVGTRYSASGQGDRRAGGTLLKVERLPQRARAAFSPALAAWLARLLPFIRALFARQMPGLPPAEMLHKPGRITRTRTHIDLYQSFDQIDMRVRASGFDRDPAWVPDLGYIILFHFE